MSTHAAHTITASDIRLARALVADAARRGKKESPQIEKIARTRTAEDS